VRERGSRKVLLCQLDFRFLQVKGQGIYAFVTVMEGQEMNDSLKNALKKGVRSEIGAFAAPDVIHWASGLPKTRSGKIMRRILRKLAANKLDELVRRF
jgi:acetyl-CoA synthetase